VIVRRRQEEDLEVSRLGETGIVQARHGAQQASAPSNRTADQHLRRLRNGPAGCKTNVRHAWKKACIMAGGVDAPL
jgi:hypothetical protein